MFIAVDFDGTCVFHEYPIVGPSVPHAVRVLQRLGEDGHQLILYTMRSGIELTQAIVWFEENEIELLCAQYNPSQRVWTDSPKCYAHKYIDDAAVGCPLIHGKAERPYVDWLRIEEILYDT